MSTLHLATHWAIDHLDKVAYNQEFKDTTDMDEYMVKMDPRLLEEAQKRGVQLHFTSTSGLVPYNTASHIMACKASASVACFYNF